jgi:hypothetical protein
VSLQASVIALALVVNFTHSLSVINIPMSSILYFVRLSAHLQPLGLSSVQAQRNLVDWFLDFS